PGALERSRSPPWAPFACRRLRPDCVSLPISHSSRRDSLLGSRFPPFSSRFHGLMSGKRMTLLPSPPSSQVGLLPPSPLGTDRESFPSISSSLSNAPLRTRFHHF